jgi:PKD repeat protein
LNASTYLWSFPGGNPSVSTDPNPTGICYNTPGSYEVTLIITNGNLSDTLLISNCITVYPAPPPQGIIQSGDTLIANQGAVSYQWYHNGNLIPGATDYMYVADVSGNFNVVCTDENGCEVEAVIFDVIAGMSAISPGVHGVSIIPNPADKILQLTTVEPVQVSIIDALGKTVYKSPAPSKSFTIETSGFDKGIYFLIYTTENYLSSEKFVITH